MTQLVGMHGSKATQSNLDNALLVSACGYICCGCCGCCWYWGCCSCWNCWTCWNCCCGLGSGVGDCCLGGLWGGVLIAICCLVLGSTLTRLLCVNSLKLLFLLLIWSKDDDDLLKAGLLKFSCLSLLSLSSLLFTLQK